MKLLFDASSLLYALKLGNLEILKKDYIQWLAVYKSSTMERSLNEKLGA